MRDLRVGMPGYIVIHLLPVPLIIVDALAPRTHGQQASQLLHLPERLSKLRVQPLLSLETPSDS